MRYAVVVLLALSLAGCGGTIGIGGVTPGYMVVVRGLVSSVQLSSVVATGGFVQVTLVGLETSGTTQQFAFCGDNSSQFPMHTSVTVNFNPGQDCNQISVVITG